MASALRGSWLFTILRIDTSLLASSSGGIFGKRGHRSACLYSSLPRHSLRFPADIPGEACQIFFVGLKDIPKKGAPLSPWLKYSLGFMLLRLIDVNCDTLDSAVPNLSFTILAPCHSTPTESEARVLFTTAHELVVFQRSRSVSESDVCYTHANSTEPSTFLVHHVL